MLPPAVMRPAIPDRRGFSVFRGWFVLPERGDGLLNTARAARLVGVDPSTLSKWRERGHITPDGLDERGRPLYRRDTVLAAEQEVRERGIATSGIDPRRLRRRAA